jgi:tetratricopeptide (TPR) repeat protein
MFVPFSFCRRILASFFTSDHPSIDPYRRAAEASWAFTCLKDGASLAEFLASARILSHFWCDAGDVGRLELVKLWKVAEDLCCETGRRERLPVGDCAAVVSDSNIQPKDTHIDTEPALPHGPMKAEVSLAAKHLCALGAQLGDALLVATHSQCNSPDVLRLDFPSFKVLRSLFELLKDLRLEASAYDFLVHIQGIIERALLVHSCEKFDPVLGCIRVAFAWVHACIGDSLKDLGNYSGATSMWMRAIQEFAAIPGVAPNHVVCELHRSLGVVHDLEKRYEDALSEFELARSGIAALAEQYATKLPYSDEAQSTSKSPHLDEFHSLIADFNDSQKISNNSSRLQIFSADIDKEVANVLFSLHRFEEALNCYRGVHATLKRVLGEAHPTTARAIWGVGVSLCLFTSQFLIPFFFYFHVFFSRHRPEGTRLNQRGPSLPRKGCTSQKYHH